MLTLAETKRKAERMFLNGNPGCRVVKWESSPKLYTARTGNKFREGKFLAYREEDGAWVTIKVNHCSMGTGVTQFGRPRVAV